MSDKDPKEFILNHLRLHSFSTVDELLPITKASPATIRRDLVRMDKEGIIRKAHGGATFANYLKEQPKTREKQLMANAEKHAIDRQAATLVKDGDSLLIDAGTLV